MRTNTALGLGLFLAASLGATGCATTTIEPGHRGLYFAPNDGGLKREALMPGRYKLGWCFIYCTPNRVDDFDVTYSTKTEEIDTKSSEGLDLHLRLSVIYKPIESELYQLDTEIGPAYYEEVIGPEFRSACRGVFARHSYTELQKKNEQLENEVEAEVRRRTVGKHLDISSVTLESVTYAPEIAEKIRQKISGEQEAARQQAAIVWETEKKKQIAEAEAAQKKLELESAAATQKIELEKEAENARFKAEQDLAQIETQKKVTKAQAEIARLNAETAAQTKVIEAKAQADAQRHLARAHAEERRAETAGVTPMEVMIHAYDALGRLGGTGTTLVLGDWAHVPNFLFPRVPSLQSAFMLPYAPYGPPPAAAPPASGPSADASPKGDPFLSSASAQPNPY
jgi:regulator of protease activity HflC (stomatin/prohibitin superfamily)